MDYEELMELAHKAIDGSDQDRRVYLEAYEAYTGDKLCMEPNRVSSKGGGCIFLKGTPHTHRNVEGYWWS